MGGQTNGSGKCAKTAAGPVDCERTVPMTNPARFSRQWFFLLSGCFFFFSKLKKTIDNPYRVTRLRFLNQFFSQLFTKKSWKSQKRFLHQHDWTISHIFRFSNFFNIFKSFPFDTFITKNHKIFFNFFNFFDFRIFLNIFKSFPFDTFITKNHKIFLIFLIFSIFEFF